MKVLFAIATASALILSATAQQQTPPPVTAPPPLNPNIVPARPQPGVVTGATGRSALPAPPAAIPPRGSNTFTPFPVAVAPNTHPVYPEVFDPLELVEFYQILDSIPDVPVNGGTAQGRPGGGLGVTITGGSTNPPPITPPHPAVQAPAQTNIPAATNITTPGNPSGAPANATPGQPTTPTYR